VFFDPICYDSFNVQTPCSTQITAKESAEDLALKKNFSSFELLQIAKPTKLRGLTSAALLSTEVGSLPKWASWSW
jgi:hypothetical protein